MTEKIFKIIYNELGRNLIESYPPMDKANLELILDKYYDEVKVTEIETPQMNYVIDYCTCKKSEPNPHNMSKCYFCDKILNKGV